MVKPEGPVAETVKGRERPHHGVHVGQAAPQGGRWAQGTCRACLLVGLAGVVSHPYALDFGWPGQMMELTVAADSDFNDVKKLIWKQTGYPVDSQVLLYAIRIFPSAARMRPVTTLC